MGFTLVGLRQSCEGRPGFESPAPMTTILLFFVLGIVLLALDFFMPGLVLSILGACAMLVGTAQAFEQYGISGGLIAFAIAAVLSTIAIYLEYVVLPKTRLGKKLFLHASVQGVSQPVSEGNALTGREGVAITPLVPTGQIEIDGRRHEALSLDGQVERGGRVKVTGFQNFSLTVTKL
ncbi:MAG TPA: NfeD family protein [Opitutaceae bacterium]|nr:NfeD family protein [Opitutaceae bacterium]